MRDGIERGEARHPNASEEAPRSDVQGLSQLAVDAVVGIADVVEATHRAIASLSPIVGSPAPDRTRGITGFVYRSVRGVTYAVGDQLQTALAYLAPLEQRIGSSRRREAALATLNGVIGDHLATSANPLAIPMRLRQNGRPLVLNPETLDATVGPEPHKVVVLMHGLCMSDRGWRRDGHDHGIALARDFGYTPLYLHYNSGQPIATNGRAFAALMEQLVEAWPVPITDLVLVGHSMGGLVARSACHYAEGAGHAWLGRLSKLICLGTPHHGAPLERAGRWVDRALGLSPYTAPFGRLGLIRSAGVQDLRYGTIVDEKDPAGTSAQRGGEPPHEPRTTVLLPAGISCFAIAATKQRRDRPSRWLSGDGLVPVSSALGWHEDPAQTLPIPPSHQHLCYGLDHFDLLGSHAVYDRLCHWVAQD